MGRLVVTMKLSLSQYGSSEKTMHSRKELAATLTVNASESKSANIEDQKSILARNSICRGPFMLLRPAVPKLPPSWTFKSPGFAQLG